MKEKPWAAELNKGSLEVSLTAAALFGSVLVYRRVAYGALQTKLPYLYFISLIVVVCVLV